MRLDDIEAAARLLAQLKRHRARLERIKLTAEASTTGGYINFGDTDVDLTKQQMDIMAIILGSIVRDECREIGRRLQKIGVEWGNDE